MSLEALRIVECPLAFASFAEKHNALVDLISQIRGANGITVTISERNGIITGGGSSNANTAGLDARITTLETLTTGMSRQSVLYCSGGSNTTITILRT
jgi:hypothetical protein